MKKTQIKTWINRHNKEVVCKGMGLTLKKRGRKPASFDEARQLIDEYIDFYNNERIQTKTRLTPLEKRCQSG